MKHCPRCDTHLDTSKFRPNKATKDKLQSWCNPCFAEYAKGRDKEHLKNNWNSWYGSKGKEWSRNYDLIKHFGITLEEYRDLLRKQGGKCAMCKSASGGKTKSGKDKVLSVDHCHVTGRIRGLLCTACNSGLGLLGDNPAKAANMLRYYDASDPEVDAEYY